MPQGNQSPPKITEDQLGSWSLLGGFRAILEKVKPALPKALRKGGPKRLLDEADYFCAFLFAQFNPVIDSMRGLCACSGMERVQQEVCPRRVSLGSFSEAQSVFGYPTRYWAVYVDGELPAVVLYRKGAEANRLMDLAHPPQWRASVEEE